MTNAEALEMAKAKLECLTREVSGTNEDCIHDRCDDCEYNYAQGNMGEQKEWLRLAIKALEQHPSENEEIIKVSKGALKARRGRFVIYDAEWLKEHFNTTETKLYGQPREDTGGAKMSEIPTSSESKGVLEQIAEEQNSLLASCKAWGEAIDKAGYVN